MMYRMVLWQHLRPLQLGWKNVTVSKTGHIVYFSKR